MYTIDDLHREIEKVKEELEKETDPKKIRILKKNLDNLYESLHYETGAKKDENEKCIECPACGQKLIISLSLYE